MILCKVLMLDGSELELKLEKKTTGEELLEKVYDHLNLVEKDYFSLSYRDNDDVKFWINKSKRINKQLKNDPCICAFEVKFYPPDPSSLQEDLTRYQVCLQVRRDILTGKLPCSFVTHALLGSYTVQSELGDYSLEEHGRGIEYIKDIRFAPNQNEELLDKIAELHKTHKGQCSSEAELKYLENAKKLAMYGMDLHPAKDSEGVEILIGVCSSGLVIYRDRLRINRFCWGKIQKISYKRNNFYIKLRPGEFEQMEEMIGFKLLNHTMSKRLWKTAVEHHTFFRLREPDPPIQGVLSRIGSGFQYEGKTEYQLKQANVSVERPPPPFNRGGKKKVATSLSFDTGGNAIDGGKAVDSSTLEMRGKPAKSSSSNTPLVANQQIPLEQAKIQTAPLKAPPASIPPQNGVTNGNGGFRSIHHGDMNNINPSVDQKIESVVAKKTVLLNARPSSRLLNNDEFIYDVDMQDISKDKDNNTIVKTTKTTSSSTPIHGRPSSGNQSDQQVTHTTIITEQVIAPNGDILESKEDIVTTTDNIDYDNALTQAIESVTKVNQNLKVENIDTKEVEEKMQSSVDYY